MSRTAPRKLLIVEDIPVDAEMMTYELERAGLRFETLCVSDKRTYVSALREFSPDIIMSDFSLPSFNAIDALALRHQFCPEIPFIIVSGSLGEERAVEILRAGATDYVLKHNLARLATAVNRALADAEAERARLRIARELEAERQLLSAVLDTSNALVVLLDEAGRIVRINPAAAACAEMPAAQVIGQHFWDLFAPPGEVEISRAAFMQVMGRRHPAQKAPSSAAQQAPWREVDRRGRVIVWSISFLENMGLHGEIAVLAGIDVTEHEAAKTRAYELSYFDPQTRLPNLALFRDRLKGWLLRASAHQRRLVLVLLSVDRMGQVRDSLGAAIGDLLLNEAVRRLREFTHNDDTLARIGDNTLAMAFDAGHDETLTERLKPVLSLVRSPYSVDDRLLHVPVHMGVAVHPTDVDDVTSLLHAAEAALHRAANSEGSGIEFYAPALFDQARERLLLESELRHALQHDGGGLMLYYQPQVDVRSGRVVGAEALLRWQHPRLGLLNPAQFISLAEESDLIVALGHWVITAACRQAQEWDLQNLPPLRYAVNLSSRQFAHPDIVELVQDAVRQAGFDPERLELELTESTSMREPEASIATMHRLRDMGVRLAIDDFGTGYSNLSYLKRFPVHMLKLDRAFVQDITSDPNDLAISRAVSDVAHRLRLEIIAEGVETPGQLTLLAEARCDLMQGYLASRPLSAHEFAAFVKSDFRLDAPHRQRHQQHTLMYVAANDDLLDLPQPLQSDSMHLLKAGSVHEAYELLAMHEVRVIVVNQYHTGLQGLNFITRVRDLYPDIVILALGNLAEPRERLDGIVVCSDMGHLSEALQRGLAQPALAHGLGGMSGMH